MKKNIIIIILLSFVLGAMARLIECRGDIRTASRKRNRDYEFVDVEIGCECGNKLSAETPYREKAFRLWEVSCSECNAKYVLSKTPFKVYRGDIRIQTAEITSDPALFTR